MSKNKKLASRKAPEGKFRVLKFDTKIQEYVVMDDFDTLEEAEDAAEKESIKEMGGVFYIYDDQRKVVSSRTTFH